MLIRFVECSMGEIMFCMFIIKIALLTHTLKLEQTLEMICSGTMLQALMIDFMGNQLEQLFIIELVRSQLSHQVFMVIARQ